MSKVKNPMTLSPLIFSPMKSSPGTQAFFPLHLRTQRRSVYPCDELVRRIDRASLCM